MKIQMLVICLLLITIPLTATKYAGEIFALSPGVLSSAMGATGLTYENNFSAGWWNPALLSIIPENGMELMRCEHFEGLMAQNQLSIILGSNTKTSFTLNHLAIDKIKLTKLENPNDSLSNENRPIVWKTVSNQDFILSAGIARKVGKTLSLGISPKLAYRTLAENSGYAFGADLGMLWQISNKARLGMNLRDFFSTQVLWEGGEYETVIPNLDLELGYNFTPIKKIPVHLAWRSEILLENREATVEAGDLSADFHAGIAVQPISNLRLLAGYDVDCFTAGIAVSYKCLGLNYAFRNGSEDDLGYSQRVSASYQW
ncbi:MAG: hypothetical protein KA963_00625 [Candidatus Cloacimonas sp.]|mgnify:FL=1|jgi:hypothetical protein|nr:hypothetical protein [Candidatus Cloacimonas sp.]HNX02053.1 hypothetical protein [Candidatus Cloacimonas sp.]HPS60054.1 hypothetical protein [Candidatus Cloacimonas sp.]